MANNDLTIQMPRQGLAPSAMTGYSEIRNLDLFSVPGMARLNKKLSLASGTVATLPNWIVRDPLDSADFYALGNTGVVYQATDGSGSTWSTLSGNSTSGASGNGLAIWKDYLFVARDANLDTYGPLTSGFACTVTSASPGVITKASHGFSTQDGTTIIFSTSSSMPTGLTAGTVYYMGTVHNVNEFSVSATQGGADINTSSTGSGVSYRFWRSAASPALTFKAISSDADWHPMLVSKLDGKLYGGCANQIFKLAENSGQTFDPTNAATYTWSATALTTALPADYRIKCLAELGTNLMIGTWKGTDVRDFAVADIFPWDTTSTALGNPIILNDFGVHAMLTYGSSLIIWAGINGVVYRSDGVNFQEVAKLPVDLDSTSQWVIWSPGAVCKYKGRIFFGCGGGSDGANTISPMGIYSLQFTSKENILVLEHTNSQETTGSAEQVIVASLLPVTGQRILSGFISGSTKGMDLTSSGNYSYTTAYTAFFDTPLYQVGTPKAKRAFTELDILLAKTLATGEGLKIQYRTTYNGTYVDVGTFTHDISGTTILGTVFTHFEKANLPMVETIQFRIALKGTTTTTPALKSITFR